MPGRTAIEIPPGAGPGGRRGWHDVVYRALDLGLGRVSPRTRAALTWRLDPEIYRGSREILGALVSPGDVVVDIGASWGLFTHRLAAEVGPRGTVHAFEPNPLALPSLESIAAAQPQIAIHRVALSDASGQAELHVPTLRRAVGSPRAIHPMAGLRVPHNRTDAAHETVSVELRRLDEELAELPRPVSFVKCDVEGHELAALRGAEGLLASRPALFVEIEQRHQDTPIEDVFELLAGFGYAGHVLDGGRLRPLSAFDVERDQLAFLRPNAIFTAAPSGYLNNFLFVADDSDLSALSAA